MNNISDFASCANCGACYNICPVKAISVNKSSLFYSLRVNESICIGCGNCKSVCPVNTPQTIQSLRSAYGGYHIKAEIVERSSSGGAFSALAADILARNGVVYAAAFSPDKNEVVFGSTEDIPIDELRRSKYVESLVGDSFQTIREKLEQGIDILFCGAPCQVAGLKRYLQKDYDNLLLCDFSCGGMPSHKIYRDYLSDIRHILKSEIKVVNFRPKLFGWERYSIEIIGENGKKYQRFAFSDPYFSWFLSSRVSMREYCYECSFSNNHYSDVILADFWKHRTASKIPSNDTGISLIIANSEKGEEWVQKLSSCFELTRLDLGEATYNVCPRERDEQLLEKRGLFLDSYLESGYPKISRNFKLENNLALKTKYRIKKFLGK